MATRPPAVMVSSTFYDLREIRQQLARMISEKLGYTPLISESAMFPIDPDVATIENCRRRVEDGADILVLVIGRRYGTVDLRSGKSVTNLEYSVARSKKIPVYVFFDRETQTLYDAWRVAAPENKRAIAAAVEDARLFEFIDRVRSVDGMWTNMFTNSADITNSLRAQLAYLMQSGLAVQMALRGRSDLDELVGLTPDAYRIAVNRARDWEYMLFAQVLEDEIRAVADLRREYDLGLKYGSTVALPDRELGTWLRLRIHELLDLVHNAEAVVNNELTPAFGSLGQPGSARDITFVARQLAKVYSAIIEWSQAVRRTRASSTDFQEVVNAVASCGADIIQTTATFPDALRHRIEVAREESAVNPPAPGEHRKINMTLHFSINSEAVMKAANEAFRSRGIDPIEENG